MAVVLRRIRDIDGHARPKHINFLFYLFSLLGRPLKLLIIWPAFVDVLCLFLRIGMPEVDSSEDDNDGNNE